MWAATDDNTVRSCGHPPLPTIRSGPDTRNSQRTTLPAATWHHQVGCSLAKVQSRRPRNLDESAARNHALWRISFCFGSVGGADVCVFHVVGEQVAAARQAWILRERGRVGGTDGTVSIGCFPVSLMTFRVDMHHQAVTADTTLVSMHKKLSIAGKLSSSPSSS